MTDFERFFALVWESAKKLETELLAHVEVLNTIRTTLPERTEEINKTLEAARKHPKLAEMMHQKYDVKLAEWLHRGPESAQLKEALRLFETLEPPEQKYLQ